MVRVYLVHPDTREEGIRRLCGEIGMSTFKGAQTVLKANFNSADPFPASTHPDTLRGLAERLQDAGAGKITLIERSGMGNTRAVLEKTGVFSVAEEKGFSIQILDDLGPDGWNRFELPGMHWKKGILLPKILTGTERIVQTCCLKTHRFGGHFTMSLKNSVGLVAGKEPGGFHDYMRELHGSRDQRLMIAEINAGYRTDLVIMDAMAGFCEGGPERGKIFSPGLMLAGDDRVAIDAVGIALLRQQGSTPEVMRGKIFDLEQIARAVSTGVGAVSPEDIELVPLDDHSITVAAGLAPAIRAG